MKNYKSTKKGALPVRKQLSPGSYTLGELICFGIYESKPNPEQVQTIISGINQSVEKNPKLQPILTTILLWKLFGVEEPLEKSKLRHRNYLKSYISANAYLEKDKTGITQGLYTHKHGAYSKKIETLHDFSGLIHEWVH